MLGIAGAWSPLVVTAGLLALGGPLERWCHRHFGSDRSTPGADAR